jgi:hypothetical protein
MIFRVGFFIEHVKDNDKIPIAIHEPIRAKPLNQPMTVRVERGPDGKFTRGQVVDRVV